ncbi:MAG: hypothetical protein WBY94_08720, partial [Polyangiaceae bacterium]
MRTPDSLGRWRCRGAALAFSAMIAACSPSSTTASPTSRSAGNGAPSTATGTASGPGPTGSAVSATPISSTGMTGAAAAPNGDGGSSAPPGSGSTGGSAPDASSLSSAATVAQDADASDDGGPSPAADAGATVVVTPPVSDPTSTLAISAPGAGYKVDGNIPYGPSPMQRLDVIYPTGSGPGSAITLPGVIMFHGGGWTDSRPQALKSSMSSFFNRFLKHGFIVCNVEYRLADGTANSATAPAADQDALLAAQWFWNYMDYYHVDKSKYVV